MEETSPDKILLLHINLLVLLIRAMASSLGYALMSWSTAMAKHSKAKRKARKKQPCSSEAGNKAAAARTTSSAISEFEYVHQQQKDHSEAAKDLQSNETQTEGK